MHTLIVCGTPWCELDAVLPQLQAAGVALARPAASGSSVSMAEWHRRLLASHPGTPQSVQPGRAWELAASEIFLANWEQPLWGWADHRSTWLLDFWRQFDPQTRFVLVHTPAVDVLVNAALRTDAADFDAVQVLDEWAAHQAHMLQFYLRHADRCVWLPAGALRAVDATLALDWLTGPHIALAVSGTLPAASDPTRTLLTALARQAVRDHPQAFALQHEVWASVPTTQPPAAESEPAPQPPVATLLAQTRELVVLQAETLQQALHAQVQAKAELAAAKAQAEQQLQAQLAAETKAKQVEAAAKAEALKQRDAEAKAKAEATEEAELLLVQLHQVQEELERTFLKASELQTQLNAETKAKQAETAAKAEALKQRDAEAKAKAELAAAKAQAEQQLQAQLAAETKAKQAEAAAKAEALKQRDAEAKAKAEATEEAELLLAQLHQVQEELENYFLRFQDAQKTSEQLQGKLARWAQRYPDHCEWDAFAVQPADRSDAQAIVVRQLQHGNRTWPELHLELHHAGDALQLVLPHLPQWPSPLLRGPQQGSVVLNLAADCGSPEAAALDALAPADLQWLKAVCQAVVSALPADLPERAAWAQRWQAAAQALAQPRPVWRFNSVQLRHEQVNPDYEHLWLHFEQAQYAERSWPVFEFRLSANNVRAGKWSHLPKLEFPQAGPGVPKPFDNWFDECEDDKGPKFELRFDMKAPALDVQCWNALSALDQAQALELVRQLHGLLTQLEQAGTRIHRPWADWHLMASGIQHTLVACLGLNPQQVGHLDSSSP